MVRTLWLLACLGCAAKQPVSVTRVEFAPVADLSRLDVQGPTGAWAPGPDAELLPLSQWVRVGEVVAWTYVDPQEGASAMWGDGDVLHIRRVTEEPAGMEVLSDAERSALGLPAVPATMEHYGSQPEPGTRWGAWRSDPRLQGRFHPDYPDDIQALIGTQTADGLYPEQVWVGIRGCGDETCRAALLNQPSVAPLTRGDPLVVDIADLGPGALPPAWAPGTEPPDGLRALAAGMGSDGQDDPLWEVDLDQPPEDRLVPMSQWVRVGEEVGYVYLGAIGPEVALLAPDGEFRKARSLDWKTAGMEVLADAEVEALGLPANPAEGMEDQPSPGPWGRWRLDPVLAELLGEGGAPDTLLVQLGTVDVGAGERGEVVPLQLVPWRVSIRSCDDTDCTARVVGQPPAESGFMLGDDVSFTITSKVGGRPVALYFDRDGESEGEDPEPPR